MIIFKYRQLAYCIQNIFLSLHYFIKIKIILKIFNQKYRKHANNHVTKYIFGCHFKLFLIYWVK